MSITRHIGGVSVTRHIAGLVLAAGAGRRFGGADKQLAPLDGRPLLEHVLAAMAAVPALERVVVALGAHAPEILAAVDLHGAEPLLVEDWAEGQAASLRAGVAALAAEGADAIVVALGDQPDLTPAMVSAVVADWDGRRDAVRATHDGTPGHPVLLARSLFPALLALRGDEGARGVLAGLDVLDVACDASAVADVDTPTDLARLRQP